MKFTDYLNEAEDSKSRTDKWTLDQIKNAKYSSSLMRDPDEVYIKGKLYRKVGKDKWQHCPPQEHALGATYSDKKIFDMMNESAGKVKPGNFKELKQIVRNTIREQGPNCDLNFLDVSEITVMSGLFKNTSFNGDISKWDVKNVQDMDCMFLHSKFNGDISKWNVSRVENMYAMFAESAFNGDISKWNVKNVYDMSEMFAESAFNGDISKWNISGVESMSGMFQDSAFDKDISRWKISSDVETGGMFKGCPLEKKPEFQPKFED